MTPQERQMIDDLFDRLARLEQQPRDPEAEQAIEEGLSRAPNAVYALVQTVLVQDEALKRADARIRELSGEEEASRSGGSFLDSMRHAFAGRAGGPSVPSVGAGGGSGPDPRWNTGGANAAARGPGYAPAAAPYAAAPYGAAPSGGSSFLGTAAASAAGAIGGALLFNSISSLFGHHGGGAFGQSAAFGSPWDSSGSAANSDLAREAGLNDVGGAGNAQSAGLLDDDQSNDSQRDYDDVADNSDFDDDQGDDFGGDDFDGGTEDV